MADAIVGGQVGDGGAGCGLGKQALGFIAVRVGKQRRAGLGIERFNLAHAVVFLVRPREFMLADAVAVVMRHRCGDDQPRLRVLAHHQPVGVITRFALADQDTVVDQPAEIFRRLGIHLGRVRIDVFGQVDFSF